MNEEKIAIGDRPGKAQQAWGAALLVVSALGVILSQTMDVMKTQSVPYLGEVDRPDETLLAVQTVLFQFAKFGLYASILLICTGSIIAAIKTR